MQKNQRAAEKNDLALDGPAARQAADGLVDHCLHDGGGNVFARAALVEQGKDIGFGENPAARGNGIDSRAVPGQPVQTGGVRADEGRHLVDKRARASGAGFIHALLKAAGQKGQLGVLAAQLDNRVGIGNFFSDGQI